MHNWFTCKIRHTRMMENGMNKRVTEPYLVDALSFTEAESRIIEEITPYMTGEFVVSGVARANYSELFFQMKNPRINGINANYISLLLMKRQESKKRKQPMYWFRRLTLKMQSRNLMKA